MQRDEIAHLLPEIFRRTLPPRVLPDAAGLMPEAAVAPGAANQPERVSVLSALLGVMERLHAPDEAILENLDSYFDPNQVGQLPEGKAAAVLHFLARWVDLDWLLPEGQEYEAGLGCLRDLILAAPQLAAARGTRQGLVRFLEVATGLRGYRVEDHPARPFYIIIQCPPGAEDLRTLVERIAAGEKPAYIKCELMFEQDCQ